MRTVIAFVVGIATAAVVVGLGVLVVQNTQSEQLTFLGSTLIVDKGGVVAGGVALGFVLAVLLLLPGRLASAWHRAQVRRQTQTLEQRLVALREEHARLHGGHQRLVEEHGLVLDRVLPSPRVSLPPQADAADVAASGRWSAGSRACGSDRGTDRAPDRSTLSLRGAG